MNEQNKKYPSLKKNKLALVLILIGAFLLSIGMGGLGNMIPAVAGIALVLFGMVLAHLENKCPHCGKALRGIHWSNEQRFCCQHCGEPVEWI